MRCAISFNIQMPSSQGQAHWHFFVKFAFAATPRAGLKPRTTERTDKGALGGDDPGAGAGVGRSIQLAEHQLLLLWAGAEADPGAQREHHLFFFFTVARETINVERKPRVRRERTVLAGAAAT